MLRLGDVARVELGAQNLDRDTRLNGRPAALIAIYQSPGANAVTTLDAVQAAAERTAEGLPRRPGVEGHLRHDHLRHSTRSTR